MYAVKMENVCKSYLSGQVRENALIDINMNITSQGFTVLSGKSGSGKTTLLNLIGGIDTPDSGRIILANQPMDKLNDDQRSAFRAKNLGFIFQNFNLIPVLSVYENIEIPLILQGWRYKERRHAIIKMLENVELENKINALPGQLSGGQKQRVAIARALIHQPALILADEPTANLDSKTGKSILQLLRHLQQEYAITVIFSSHDPLVISEADDLYLVSDGSISN